jgi:hypothetical protein
MFIDRHIVPAIDRVMAPKVEAGLLRKRTPEEAEAAASAALDSGELYGIPLGPRAALEAACPLEEDRRAAIEYIAGQPTPQEAMEAAKRILSGAGVP